VGAVVPPAAPAVAVGPAGAGAGAAPDPAAPPQYGGNAVRAARTLGFPMGIAALVVLFLVVQARVDSRDPRLVAAPVDDGDGALGFW
jgi:hypothetical protein